MQHFSQRLGRNYRDDDWLTRDEVVKVIEENSGPGRRILARSVNKYSERHGWHPDRTNPRILLYKYIEVKDASMRAGPGRNQQSNPTPNAERQRLHKAAHPGENAQRLRRYKSEGRLGKRGSRGDQGIQGNAQSKKVS